MEPHRIPRRSLHEASSSPVFRFTVLAPVSEAQQQFIAQAGETGDRIARPVTVHPNGQETAVTATAILSPGDNIVNLELPADTLPGSSYTTLKLYPNLGAHLRDALQKMANYPNGCAEQIISIAWASLVLQRYSASMPQRDEKLQQQTHRNLQEAYENLLANQLPSGGFAYWPKDHNADLALTAYAIQFLAEARNFITIDDGVLSKAVAFLAKQQQAKSQSTPGLWVRVGRDRKPHPEDTRGNAMLTASIAAMIAGAPGTEPILKKAVAATQPFAEEFDEPYTLASYALAVLALKDTARSEPTIKRLRSMAHSENSGSYWALETNTPFFGWGTGRPRRSHCPGITCISRRGHSTPRRPCRSRSALPEPRAGSSESLVLNTGYRARARCTRRNSVAFTSNCVHW